MIGGAFVIAALSLILLALGAGFELSAVSPWMNVRTAAERAGGWATFWLILTQVVASALGGYLTGRLRTRWQRIHNDEVHFRDTANGFLAWAVAVVVTAAFLTSATSVMAAGAAAPRENAGPGGEIASSALDTNSYYVARLFVTDRQPRGAMDATTHAEAARVFDHALTAGPTADADAQLLAQLVSADTGIGLADAQQRVNGVLTEAKQHEDNVRKATARLLLVVFLALLLGAFCASYAATLGGRQRDGVKII